MVWAVSLGLTKETNGAMKGKASKAKAMITNGNRHKID